MDDLHASYNGRNRMDRYITIIWVDSCLGNDSYAAWFITVWISF
jgi:hypothetical protein